MEELITVESINLDDDDSFQIVVEECDTDNTRRAGYWLPFTDIYGNEFAYALGNANMSDDAEISIACKRAEYGDDVVRWVKFFTAPINMIHFEDAEEMESFFDELFHSPRYKFFARPKHLHYKGYQKIEVLDVPDPEELESQGEVTALLHSGSTMLSLHSTLPDKLPSLWDRILGNA